MEDDTPVFIAMDGTGMLPAGNDLQFGPFGSKQWPDGCQGIFKASASQTVAQFYYSDYLCNTARNQIDVSQWENDRHLACGTEALDINGSRTTKYAANGITFRPIDEARARNRFYPSEAAENIAANDAQCWQACRAAAEGQPVGKRCVFATRTRTYHSGKVEDVPVGAYHTCVLWSCQPPSWWDPVDGAGDDPVPQCQGFRSAGTVQKMPANRPEQTCKWPDPDNNCLDGHRSASTLRSVHDSKLIRPHASIPNPLPPPPPPPPPPPASPPKQDLWSLASTLSSPIAAHVKGTYTYMSGQSTHFVVAHTLEWKSASYPLLSVHNQSVVVVYFDTEKASLEVDFVPFRRGYADATRPSPMYAPAACKVNGAHSAQIFGNILFDAKKAKMLVPQELDSVLKSAAVDPSCRSRSQQLPITPLLEVDARYGALVDFGIGVEHFKDSAASKWSKCSIAEKQVARVFTQSRDGRFIVGAPFPRANAYGTECHGGFMPCMTWREWFSWRSVYTRYLIMQRVDEAGAKYAVTASIYPIWAPQPAPTSGGYSMPLRTLWGNGRWGRARDENDELHMATDGWLYIVPWNECYVIAWNVVNATSMLEKEVIPCPFKSSKHVTSTTASFVSSEHKKVAALVVRYKTEKGNAGWTVHFYTRGQDQWQHIQTLGQPARSHDDTLSTFLNDDDPKDDAILGSFPGDVKQIVFGAEADLYVFSQQAGSVDTDVHLFRKLAKKPVSWQTTPLSTPVATPVTTAANMVHHTGGRVTTDNLIGFIGFAGQPSLCADCVYWVCRPTIYGR